VRTSSAPRRRPSRGVQPRGQPLSRGIYANGIIESFQAAGENINLFPEVSGPIASILVTEGQAVTKGTPLISIDDAVQRAVVEQQRSQAEAALAQLQALKAQPRRETLAITEAQLELARANLKNAQDQYDKQSRLYEIDRKAVSKDALDSATNALKVAAANVEVAQRQLELTRAGAWSFDIENQQRQYDALHNAYMAGIAQLAKYTLRAPADGVILSIRAAVGSYASPQGTYGTYTGGSGPLLVMGGPQEFLAVRCYIDETLIHRLPEPSAAERPDVRPRQQRQPSLGVRQDAALCQPQGLTVGSADGTRRRAGAAPDLPVREAEGHRPLSGGAGGCLHRRGSGRADAMRKRAAVEMPLRCPQRRSAGPTVVRGAR